MNKQHATWCPACREWHDGPYKPSPRFITWLNRQAADYPERLQAALASGATHIDDDPCAA